MKAFEVKETSLSFRFAKWLSFAACGMSHNSRFSPYPKDFCTYWRHVLLWSPLVLMGYLIFFGLVATLLTMLVTILITEPLGFASGVGAVVLFVATILGLFWLLEVTSKYTVPAIAWVWNHGPRQVLSFIFVPIGNAIGWVFMKIVDAYINAMPKSSPSEEPSEPKQPSLLMQKYLALKGKYCPMVEYKIAEKAAA